MAEQERGAGQPDNRLEERSKFTQDAHAGQSSSNSGPAGAQAGTMAVDYEGEGDPFLGEGAHLVSGERREPQVDEDMRDSPHLVLDRGHDPRGGQKDATFHSIDPGGDRGADDLRSYEDEGPEGTR